MKTITTLLLSLLSFVTWQAKAQNMVTLTSEMQEMSKEGKPERNLATMHRLLKKYNLDELKNAEEIDALKGITALSFLKAGMFPEFERYIRLINNKFNQTSYMNMGTDNLFKTGRNRQYNEVLARKTVQLFELYKDDSTARPATFPLEDWNRFMNMAAYPYYESYAQILHANGKDSAALIYLEKAMKGQQEENLMSSTLELYATVLISTGQEEKAYGILSRMVSLGKSSLKMNEQLKKLYTHRTGSVAGATGFLDSLERNVKNAYKAEVLKKMLVDQYAPDLRLSDLNGTLVTLAEFRGKVVIIDFWATWCAPCIASMPAMKRLTYLHPEVAFLFVATSETGPDDAAQARVATYVRKNKFPEKVLMDRYIAAEKRFETAQAYKLTGIPAKIVVDRLGKLRFATSGYSTDTELINELEAMIELAKAQ